MQGSELREFVSKFPSLNSHFMGVFSINTLPKTLENRTFLFCNTARANEPGKHWICLTNINNNPEFFDSLGVDKEKLVLIKNHWKIKNLDSLKFNCSAVQSKNSISCGPFVLYFAVERLHNLDLGFNTLLNEIFTDNLDMNEQRAKNFINSFL